MPDERSQFEEEPKSEIRRDEHGEQEPEVEGHLFKSPASPQDRSERSELKQGK
jgi:hypothetical protein